MKYQITQEWRSSITLLFNQHRLHKNWPISQKTPNWNMLTITFHQLFHMKKCNKLLPTSKNVNDQHPENQNISTFTRNSASRFYYDLWRHPDFRTGGSFFLPWKYPLNIMQLQEGYRKYNVCYPNSVALGKFYHYVFGNKSHSWKRYI